MRLPFLVIAVLLTLPAACKPTIPAPGAPPGVTVASVTVTSKSFSSNGPIPIDYTCDGKEMSPQVTWSSPPEGTKSIALVVDDPDAPSGTFTHWLVYNLPPDSTFLAEGVDPSTVGAKIGMNDFESVRYGGPCPPKMQIHRYRFHVYALNAALDLKDGADRAAVDTHMNGHVLGEGTLYGTFSH
jgi:Raf kinase inhibitor-like YbhB/YbcL family protein